MARERKNFKEIGKYIFRSEVDGMTYGVDIKHLTQRGDGQDDYFNTFSSLDAERFTKVLVLPAKTDHIKVKLAESFYIDEGMEYLGDVYEEDGVEYYEKDPKVEVRKNKKDKQQVGTPELSKVENAGKEENKLESEIKYNKADSEDCGSVGFLKFTIRESCKRKESTDMKLDGISMHIDFDIEKVLKTADINNIDSKHAVEAIMSSISEDYIIKMVKEAIEGHINNKAPLCS